LKIIIGIDEKNVLIDSCIGQREREREREREKERERERKGFSSIWTN